MSTCSRDICQAGDERNTRRAAARSGSLRRSNSSGTTMGSTVNRSFIRQTTVYFSWYTCFMRNKKGQRLGEPRRERNRLQTGGVLEPDNSSTIQRTLILLVRKF